MTRKRSPRQRRLQSKSLKKGRKRPPVAKRQGSGYKPSRLGQSGGRLEWGHQWLSPFPQFPPVQWHGGRLFTPSSISRPGQVLGLCFACNEFGHLRANCPKTAMAPSASKYPHNNDSLYLSVELPGECSSEREEERIEV